MRDPRTQKLAHLIVHHSTKLQSGEAMLIEAYDLRHGLVLDLVVERGNPADSTLAQKAISRVRSVLGRAPKQVTFDGGFSSKANVQDIKAMGVEDVVFSKHVGLDITDMAKSSWVFRKLRNFRAGVEAGISFLKRTFRLGRCSWSGFDSFSAYAWGSVLSCNLLVLARHLLV